MKKRKVLLIIIIATIFITLLILFVYNTHKDKNKPKQVNNEEVVEPYKVIDINNKNNVKIKDNKKINISEKINKEHNIKGLRNISVKDISISANTESDTSTFDANIVNKNKSSIDGLILVINFLDNNGEVFYDHELYIERLNGGETKKISFEELEDFSNANDITIQY